MKNVEISEMMVYAMAIIEVLYGLVLWIIKGYMEKVEELYKFHIANKDKVQDHFEELESLKKNVLELKHEMELVHKDFKHDIANIKLNINHVAQSIEAINKKLDR